jgi:hypothetical protein
VWGLFQNGCIATDLVNGARIIDDQNTAQIDPDTLKILVRHMVDKMVHSVDINVGLHPQADLVAVSDWSYGFPAPLGRAVTYRLYAFHDDGVLADVDFQFTFTVRFAWASDDMALFDAPQRTLTAALIDGSLNVESVEGIPVDFSANLSQAMLAPMTVATVPVDEPGMNPPVRVIVDMFINPAGGLAFPLNPFGNPGSMGAGSFGPIVQQKLDDIVQGLLES